MANRLRAAWGGHARAAFNACTLNLSANTFLEGAVAGTVIGSLTVTGYSGEVTLSLVDTQGTKIALSDASLLVGLTPTVYATNQTLSPVIKITANNGGATKFVTLAVTVQEAEETPIEGAITLKSTQTKLIDVSSILSTCPQYNYVELAVSGSVTADVWVHEQVANGQSISFGRHALLDNLAAVTFGAAVGNAVGTWTLTWRVGADNTGATASATITFNVSDALNLRFDMGADTARRYGGWSIAAELPGSPSLYSITNQSVANAFEIFGYRVVWKAAGTPTATEYGSTKVITNPIIGPAAYWVDLTRSDTLVTYRLIIDVTPGVSDIAPVPTSGPNAMSTSNLFNHQLYVVHLYPGNFGSRIRLETGNYTYGSRLTIQIANGNGDQRTGGPGAPTDMDSPGWIVFESKEYLGAWLHEFTVDYRNLAANYIEYKNIFFVEFINNAPGNSGTKRCTYTKHNCCRGYIFAVNAPDGMIGSDNMYLRKCDYLGTRTNVSLNAQDSQMIGCRFEGTEEDAVHHSNYCLKPGDIGYSAPNKAKHNFNFFRNKKMWNGTTQLPHPDFIQGDYRNDGSSWTAPRMSAGQQYVGPTHIGNIMTHGVGAAPGTVSRYGETTKEPAGGQGIFCNDPLAALVYTIAGNIYLDAYSRAIQADDALTGTLIANNTILFDHAPNQPGEPGYNAAGGAAAQHPVIHIEGSRAGNSIVRDNITLAISVNGDPGDAATTTQTGNVVGGSYDLSWQQSLFTNPLIGRDAQTVRQVVEALTPIAASAAEGKGAIVPALIDHQTQWYAPELLEL